MKIAIDKFNSDIFQMKMGNITDIPSDVKIGELKNYINEAAAQGYKHLNVKIPTDRKTTTNLFLENGFELVDTQLMYSIPVENRGGYWIQT